MATPRLTRLLLLHLDHAFDRQAWHGTTLRGALRGITVAQATWRPAPGRHSIWEYLLHAAYWKYIVRRRLERRLVRGAFPRKPSNWPAVPDPPTAPALRADIALLREEHRLLRKAIGSFPPSRFEERPTTSSGTYLQLIVGVAAHDIYHTGQIQLLKRLQRERP